MNNANCKIIWKRLKELKEQEILVSARVIEVGKYDSLIVDVEGITGFVSSIDIETFYFQTPKQKLLGQKLDLEIVEVDEYRKRLILSYSLPIKKRRIKQLKRGQEIIGRVISIKPYSIFVDIGDIYGFVDKSKTSSYQTLQLDSIFEVGESIAVNIIDIDREKYRVFLSIKT